MLGTQFYNQAVRKTVVSFGTLFNNIELKKIVDGQVTAADDALVTADDDFGFSEGMSFL